MDFHRTEQNTPTFGILLKYKNKYHIKLIDLIFSYLCLKALPLEFCKEYSINAHIGDIPTPKEYFKIINNSIKLLYIYKDSEILEVSNVYHIRNIDKIYNISYTIIGPIEEDRVLKSMYLKDWIIIKKDDSIGEYINILRDLI